MLLLWPGAHFCALFTWLTSPGFNLKVTSLERLHWSLHQTQLRILLLFSLMQSQIKGPARQEGYLGDQSIKVPKTTQEWVLQTEENMYLSKFFPSDKVLVFLFTVKLASDHKLMTGTSAEPINQKTEFNHSAATLSFDPVLIWTSDNLFFKLELK